MGNPRNCQQLKQTTTSFVFKMNSVPLKHKVQSGIAAPCPFPASFIGHFTAIFYAHERKINVEISSLEICSLFFFFGFFFLCMTQKSKLINVNFIAYRKQLKYNHLFWTFPNSIQFIYFVEWTVPQNDTVNFPLPYLSQCFYFL